VRRREFAESVALAALAPLLGAAASSERLDALLAATALETAGLPAAEEPGALARALAEAIRVQYGARLEAGDLDTIARQIQASLERAEQIRKLDLANGDEPDVLFSVVTGRPTT
jgi:hypothetical protein